MANESKKTENVEKKEKTVKIILPLTKELRDDVPVWVNDRSWLIQRGVEVEVPECCYSVLKHQQDQELAAVKYSESLQN